jgi:hypothetical protein
MEIEDVDPVSGLTEDQKNQNFLKILKTIEYLEKDGRITEDWIEEHKKLIETYREWIPDYSVVNGDITDGEFRKMCQHTETLMCHLYYHVRVTKTLDLKVYYMFLTYVKKCVDSIMSDSEMADLLSMMRM